MALIPGGTFAPFSNVAHQLEQERQGRQRIALEAARIAEQARQAQNTAIMRRLGLDFQREQFEYRRDRDAQTLAMEKFKAEMQHAEVEARRKAAEQEARFDQMSDAAQDAIKYGIIYDIKGNTVKPITPEHELWQARQEYLKSRSTDLGKMREKRMQVQRLDRMIATDEREYAKMQQDLRMLEANPFSDEDQKSKLKDAMADLAKRIEQNKKQRDDLLIAAGMKPAAEAEPDPDPNAATEDGGRWVLPTEGQRRIAESNKGVSRDDFGGRWVKDEDGDDVAYIAKDGERFEVSPGTPRAEVYARVKAKKDAEEATKPHLVVNGVGYRVRPEYEKKVVADRAKLIKDLLKAKRSGNTKAMMKAMRERKEYISKHPDYFYKVGQKKDKKEEWNSWFGTDMKKYFNDRLSD